MTQTYHCKFLITASKRKDSFVTNLTLHGVSNLGIVRYRYSTTCIHIMKSPIIKVQICIYLYFNTKKPYLLPDLIGFLAGFNMMTSSNGNIFRVTGHLCGEFTAQWPVTQSFDVLWASSPLWHHCYEDIQIQVRMPMGVYRQVYLIS